jgi:hypothetical protein
MSSRYKSFVRCVVYRYFHQYIAFFPFLKVIIREQMFFNFDEVWYIDF